jgi:GNAT superfamily N-acetyltransferase
MIVHTVRVARLDDVDNLVELCAEHAAFERSPFEADGKADRLRAALFGSTPVLRAWVATVKDEVVGYATVTEDFSTWEAAPFLHIDCLFVRPGYRNGGVGAALLKAAVQYASERDLHEVQWQTPAWNSDACRFYLRHGATTHDKARFCLQIGVG